MATNYYNVLDRPLGFTLDSQGRLTRTEPSPHTAIMLGNYDLGSDALVRDHHVLNIANLSGFVPNAIYTSDNLATAADALGAATLNGLMGTAGDYIYVGATHRFYTIEIDVNAPNSTASALIIEYYNKVTGAWTAVSGVTDGSESPAGTPFAIDGNITMWTLGTTMPSGWGHGKLTDIASAADSISAALLDYYWVRLSFGTAFDAATSTTAIRAQIAAVVGCEWIVGHNPTVTDDTLLEALDVTATSHTDFHTGSIQAITSAFKFNNAAAPMTNSSGACFVAWPTFFVGANRTITNAYGFRVINSGGTYSGGFTNYTGLDIGAMTHNVSADWVGVSVGSYTGTQSTGSRYGIKIGAMSGTLSAASQVAYGLDIGANSVAAAAGSGIKAGINIGNISGTALVNVGLWIGTVTAGAVNVGVHVSDKGMTVVGRVREYLTNTDVDAQNNTLTVAQIVGGIVTHTSVTGAGTVTLDTAANIIAGSSGNGQLWADNQTITVLYVNDGTQTLTVNGAATGITYADAGQTIAADESAIIYITRTSSTTCTVRLVGA